MRYRFGELLTLQMNSETARKVVFNGGNVDDRKIYRHRILSIFYTIPRIIVVSTVNENGRAIRARIWRTIYSTSSRIAFQSTSRFFLPLLFFYFFLSFFYLFLFWFLFFLSFFYSCHSLDFSLSSPIVIHVNGRQTIENVRFCFLKRYFIFSMRTVRSFSSSSVGGRISVSFEGEILFL